MFDSLERLFTILNSQTIKNHLPKLSKIFEMKNSFTKQCTWLTAIGYQIVGPNDLSLFDRNDSIRRKNCHWNSCHTHEQKPFCKSQIMKWTNTCHNCILHHDWYHMSSTCQEIFRFFLSKVWHITIVVLSQLRMFTLTTTIHRTQRESYETSLKPASIFLSFWYDVVPTLICTGHYQGCIFCPKTL